MRVDLAPDVWNEIQRLLASGAYTSPDDVLRDALVALRDRERQAVALQNVSEDMEPPDAMPVDNAIREAIDDLRAGRYRPVEEVSREIERKFNFRGK
jgi:Arc/MetJ-type ribon-helix-helix transcriptional regulator